MNLKKFGKILVSVYEGIGAAAMGLLAVLVIFTVIMRYCFSLNWKELSEFNVTLFAFTTFWAMGLNVLRGEHVSITILYDAVPNAARKVFSILSCIVMFVVDWQFVRYGCSCCVPGGQFVRYGCFRAGGKSTAAGILAAWVGASLFQVASLCCVIVFLSEFLLLH